MVSAVLLRRRLKVSSQIHLSRITSSRGIPAGSHHHSAAGAAAAAADLADNFDIVAGEADRRRTVVEV